VTRLSVVVPALNEAVICAERLERLQPLRAAGHELILVDGGSRDGTAGLARPLVDRLLVTPAGRARQMNAGAAAAGGDVLWFLHLDSQVPTDAADRLLAAVTGGAPWGRFDLRLDGRAPMLRVVERMINLRSRVTGVATGDQGIFVTGGLFEAVGGFPELPLMEDIALSDRLRRRHRPACLTPPIVTSARRWERDGVWRTILLMWFLRGAYRLGADPRWLARVYYPGV
jgi:rSAM/selenodomain-associated transferase 2